MSKRQQLFLQRNYKLARKNPEESEIHFKF